MNRPLARTFLVGDDVGLPELLARVPRERVAGLVVAGNRPAGHAALRALAAAKNLPCLVQPVPGDVDAAADFLAQLQRLQPDGLLCHSYSLRIPLEILTLVEGFAFNLHFSLLPRNRGPNPVQWALIHGEQTTGVTLHVMSEDFDSGPIVAQQQVAIALDDTWVTLKARLARQATMLLDSALPKLLAGDWEARMQKRTAATHNPRLTPQTPRIDFAVMRDEQVYNLIRAQVAPLKGAYIETEGHEVRFAQYMPLAAIADLRKRYA